MTRALLVPLLALALAVPATATAGNVEAPDLEAKIRSTTRIMCSTDWAHDPFGGERGVAGYALLADNAAVLSTDTCAILRGPLLVNPQWAAEVNVLLHELSHVWWQNRDESATECFALYIYRWEVRHGFGLN